MTTLNEKKQQYVEKVASNLNAVTLTANSAIDLFDKLEKIDNFRADCDLIRFAIESCEPVTANETIAAEKARLTMINRASRVKRLKKFQTLSEPALMLLSQRCPNPEIFETSCRNVYAQDKVAQLCRFLTGESDVFGLDCNNAAIYGLRAIAEHMPALVTTEQMKFYIERHGQPAASSQTQASSNNKSFAAFGFFTELKRGLYKPNYKDALFDAVLTACGK